MFNAIHCFEWSDPLFTQCPSLGIVGPIGLGCSSASFKVILRPVSDVPERHLGFPFGPFRSKGWSIIDLWLVHSVTTTVDYILMLMIGSPSMRLLGHHGNHLWCDLMQASLFCIVVLPLELFLGPWSASIACILILLVHCIAIVNEGGKSSNLWGAPCHAICVLFPLIPTVFLLS